jgi:dGTP triphosphohydrolase
MDKSKYKAQMDDIIKISVDNIYKNREVIEKEIVGYQIIQTLLDKFITALIINNGECVQLRLFNSENVARATIWKRESLRKITAFVILFRCC